MMWQPGVTLDQVEKEVIITALRFYQGNKTQTAKALGIALKTLFNKLEIYGGGLEASQATANLSLDKAAQPDAFKPTMKKK